MSFTTLPPEIRAMIYEMLFSEAPVIRVKSLRRKTKEHRKLLRCRAPGNILYLNKMIHSEASPLLHSRTVFVVGNGRYGSTTSPNLEGLKKFTARVCSANLASITDVWMDIHVRTIGLRSLSYEEVLGNASNVSDLKYIVRTLVKHFTGLKSIRFYSVIDSSFCDYNESWRNSDTRGSTVSGLVSLIKMLLSHPKAREMAFTMSSGLGFQDVIDRLSEEEPVAGRILRIKHTPGVQLYPNSMFLGVSPAVWELSW